MSIAYGHRSARLARPRRLARLLSRRAEIPRPPACWADGEVIGHRPVTGDWQENSDVALALRGANTGYLWAISDSPTNLLMAISIADGSGQGVWDLDGASTSDWEGLASARINGVAYLYIGDLGDNSDARSTITIFRVKEPIITGDDGTVDVADYEAVVCEYPSGDLPTHNDAETLLVDPATGDMYVITKRFTPAKAYRLAHAASYTGTQTLEAMGEISTPPLSDNAQANGTGGYVVGGYIAPDGRQIVLKNYVDLFLYTRDPKTQTIAEALAAAPTRLPCYNGGANGAANDGRLAAHPNTEPQGEGVCFGLNGLDLFTLSEFASTKGSASGAYPTFRYRRQRRSYVEASFQQGASGYSGTVDNYVQETLPDTANGSATTIVLDKDVGDERYGLLKFDLSAIPNGARIVGCDLTVYVTAEGQDFAIYRMLKAWDGDSTYNTLGASLARDDVDAASVADVAMGNFDTLVDLRIRMKIPVSTIQAWVDGAAANYGWLLINEGVSNDGFQFASSDNATAASRPLLAVRFLP